MNVTCSGSGSSCRLTIKGSMTIAFLSEMEDKLIDAMRRYRHIEVDLSGVGEIDRCGLRLLGLLKSVAHVTTSSPAVEQAAWLLVPSCGGTGLGRVARKKCVTKRGDGS